MTDPLSEPELTALEQLASGLLNATWDDPETPRDITSAEVSDVLLRLIAAYRAQQEELKWRRGVAAMQKQPPEETR